MPTEDTSFAACYTSSFTQTPAGYVTFTVSRPLDCNIDKTFVVTLDTEL